MQLPRPTDHGLHVPELLMARVLVFTRGLMLLMALSSGHAATRESTVSVVAPESVGFSSQRLGRLDSLMQEAVDERQYAGALILVARHGKIVHLEGLGKRDLASAAPVSPDTILRIFSMSKPITAAAMMILYEEGKWTPQDPLAKFIPEFAGLKVYKGIGRSGAMILEAPDHPPTLHELMTMTAGFSYGMGSGPVDNLYRRDHWKTIFDAPSLQAMIDQLAKAPLLYQPSTRWVYSLSPDIQGNLIERLSGMTLPLFMQKYLFAPLKMVDTDFYVPSEKRCRYATLYELDSHGLLTPTEGPTWPSRTAGEPALPMGSAGLVSTVIDYFRFAQMLLNGGELEGVRVLSPRSVKLMMSNHLAPDLMREFTGGEAAFNHPRPGVGFGYNGVVITDPGQADVPLGQGSYFWDGGGGTWFWIDPANDIVVVGATQRSGWPQLEHRSMAAVYQALLYPEL